MKRSLVVLATLALALPLGGCRRAPVSPEIRAFHHEAFVFDLHIDTPMVTRAFRYDFGKRHAAPLGFMPWMLHVDLPRAAEGGLDAALFGLVVSPFDPDPVASVDGQLDYVEKEILARHPGKIRIAHELADFGRAATEGALAIRFSLEGAHELGPKLDTELLDRWHARGIRSLTMAHFHSNAFAASSADLKPAEPGLGPEGPRLICELNLRGWAIDVAHTHPVALDQILKVTRAPVIVSHTGIATRRPSFRNIDEQQIRALAANGAVIGIIYAGWWLREDRWANLDDVAEHIEAVREIAGIDHVALGSDYDGFIWTPLGMRDVADLPGLTQHLADRGWSAPDLRKLLGGNVMRVLHEIEHRAAELRAAGTDCAAGVVAGM